MENRASSSLILISYIAGRLCKIYISIYKLLICDKIVLSLDQFHETSIFRRWTHIQEYHESERLSSTIYNSSSIYVYRLSCYKWTILTGQEHIGWSNFSWLSDVTYDINLYQRSRTWMLRKDVNSYQLGLGFVDCMYHVSHILSPWTCKEENMKEIYHSSKVFWSIAAGCFGYVRF